MTSRKEGEGFNLFVAQVQKGWGIWVWQRGNGGSEKVQICVTSIMNSP